MAASRPSFNAAAAATAASIRASEPHAADHLAARRVVDVLTTPGARRRMILPSMYCNTSYIHDSFDSAGPKHDASVPEFGQHGPITTANAVASFPLFFPELPSREGCLIVVVRPVSASTHAPDRFENPVALFAGHHIEVVTRACGR